LAPFVAEYGARWGWHFEPDALIGLSMEACEALGLKGEDLICAAAYAEIETPWTNGTLPSGWYTRGKALIAGIEARFGAQMANPADWKHIRASARRRLRTAERAIEAAR
jgi:hypothetical protein